MGEKGHSNVGIMVDISWKVLVMFNNSIKLQPQFHYCWIHLLHVTSMNFHDLPLILL